MIELDDKKIIVEIYIQECESLRFFENLKFKLHFFVFTGIFIILAFFWKNYTVLSYYQKVLLALFMSILVISVVIICIVITKKHSRRMLRLSKITEKLGLHNNGIYSKYETSKWYHIENVIYIPYIIIILYFFFLALFLK